MVALFCSRSYELRKVNCAGVVGRRIGSEVRSLRPILVGSGVKAAFGGVLLAPATVIQFVRAPVEEELHPEGSAGAVTVSKFWVKAIPSCPRFKTMLVNPRRVLPSLIWRFAVIVPPHAPVLPNVKRSEEHTSELQSRLHLVCRLLLEKTKTQAPASQDTMLQAPISRTPLARCGP